MEDLADRIPSVNRRISLAWHAAGLWTIFIGSLIGTTIALSLPTFQRESALMLEVNDVTQQDILAPHALSFTSKILTEQERQAAAEAVLPIFDPPDNNIARQQVGDLIATLDFIGAVRADIFATTEQQMADLAALSDIRLSREDAQMLLDLPEPRWEAVRRESIAVLEQVMRSEIRQDRLEEARRGIPTVVSISLPGSQVEIVELLVNAFVAPNTLYNEGATLAARQEAMQGVAPVIKSFAAGETIIGRGEVVRPMQLEALQAYGLLQTPDRWQQVAIHTLLVTVLASALGLYVFRAHPNEIRNIRIAGTVGGLFVLTTLALQAMIVNDNVIAYLFPAATLPMLMAILLGPGSGVMAAVVSGAFAGFLAPHGQGVELGMYVTLSGTLGALMIGRAERLSAFVWSGLAADMAAVAIVVVFRLPDPGTDALAKASFLGAAIVTGLLSASLGFALLLLIGNLFGITTNLQLIELSRPDHPLLQFLLRNAPGTYQHSLQVANMAEQAAREIGANPLLTRVGALYHDVGKALRPQFFIENQLPNQNVHEQLDPATSASMILSHVRDGLELARKYRLPPSITAFVAQHHGTMETSFQYHAALDSVGGDPNRVDRRDFLYPGPRPRSKETALLMLADGVEAKARAEMPQDEGSIDELVRWVIDDRVTSGQLDQTDLTLKDLNYIRSSFVKTLKSIHHPRLRYPQNQKVDGESLNAETSPVSVKADMS